MGPAFLGCSPAQPDSLGDGDGHPGCLHNTFLDSESPWVQFLVSLRIHFPESRDLGFSLHKQVYTCDFPVPPPSGSRGAGADERAAYIQQQQLTTRCGSQGGVTPCPPALQKCTQGCPGQNGVTGSIQPGFFQDFPVSTNSRSVFNSYQAVVSLKKYSWAFTATNSMC